tara:strand:+ start:185 stop:556 length:372 start_codon:yes stop_codon:yes gene_type:complete
VEKKQMSEELEKELVLQIMTMPADTNPQGKIFGGFILSKMDQAAGILCGNYDYVTKAVNNVVFHAPVDIGDVLQCYAKIKNRGTTSLTIKVNVHVKDTYNTLVCEGEYVMVRTDNKGRAVPNE